MRPITSQRDQHPGHPGSMHAMPNHPSKTASADWEDYYGGFRTTIDGATVIVDYEPVRGWGYFFYEDGADPDGGDGANGEFEVNFDTAEQAKAAAEG